MELRNKFELQKMEGAQQNVNVYIKNLDDDIDEKKLITEFSSYGCITSTKVIKDNQGRFGFVGYSSPMEAKEAATEMHDKIISTKPLHVVVLKNFKGVNVTVENLENGIDNKRLLTEFSRYGIIISASVIKDDNIGYVSFLSFDEASKAIAEMNGKILITKTLCVALANEKRQNLYIKNIEDDIEDERLRSEFSTFGTITSATIMKDDKGKSKGFGFVCFSSPEEAKKAFIQMNGKVLATKSLYVGFAERKEERRRQLSTGSGHGDGTPCDNSVNSHQSHDQQCNLYIKNLEKCIDDERLHLEFSTHGIITSATVMKDNVGESRGFGFVCFSSPDEAMKAFIEMNGTVVVTKPLYVAFAERKEERKRYLSTGNGQSDTPLSNCNRHQQQHVNLYIKNLDGVNDERLRSEFSTFGTITSAKIMKDDKGNSKGFGFVCFSSPDDAMKANLEMNGKVLVTKPLYVAFAQKKAERRQIAFDVFG